MFEIVLAAVAALAGCGSSGPGGGGAGFGGERTGAELIADRGPPVRFAMECTRRRFDAGSASWVDAGRTMRVDQWFYPAPEGHDVYVLVNGIVVSGRRATTRLGELAGPGIDPRRFGCDEPRSTVVSALGLGEPTLTTRGSAEEADQLTLAGGTRLQGDYYPGVASGLLITSVDGERVIGMVTL